MLTFSYSPIKSFIIFVIIVNCLIDCLRLWTLSVSLFGKIHPVYLWSLTKKLIKQGCHCLPDFPLHVLFDMRWPTSGLSTRILSFGSPESGQTYLDEYINLKGFVLLYRPEKKMAAWKRQFIIAPKSLEKHPAIKNILQGINYWYHKLMSTRAEIQTNTWNQGK